MPFRIISSGIKIHEDSRSGSADTVRRSLEYLSTITDLKIIGVFDNDREGNEKFKGLNQGIFEPHRIDIGVRKHLTKDIWGMLLPPPEGRGVFVTETSIKQRYLVIEHYFSDEILALNSMKDETILGTEVFEISGRKNDFAEQCVNLGVAEFETFRTLFDKFKNLLELA